VEVTLEYGINRSEALVVIFAFMVLVGNLVLARRNHR
jgi:hypothetical protein